MGSSIFSYFQDLFETAMSCTTGGKASVPKADAVHLPTAVIKTQAYVSNHCQLQGQLQTHQRVEALKEAVIILVQNHAVESPA
ncbi:hypothetical protein Y032_0030g2181 [Ancylostoma ceylanicum]|uniref:Uncharacterized protein n=1 Tax=Ancylostoma ceylanicum TaxID=53326 RepID=A0A016UT19_9BILA|nr:hypothetical protein Y032_0030g2181 [Ancylostoma ceylanicum]